MGGCGWKKCVDGGGGSLGEERNDLWRMMEEASCEVNGRGKQACGGRDGECCSGSKKEKIEGWYGKGRGELPWNVGKVVVADGKR